MSVDSLASRERLLEQSAVADLDLAAAREQVEGLRRSRRRTRGAMGCGAAVVLLLVAAVAVWPSQDEPDQLLADRDEPTTTTTEPMTSTTSTTAPPVVAAPAVPVAPTTSAVTTTVAPATTAPPTTAPPNQPLQAQLRLPPAEVAAGAPLTVEVAWVDPDHAGVPPVLVVDWADPALVEGVTTPATASCDRPGSSSGGVLRQTFRYATPGAHTVRVRLSSCEGQGAYGEQVELVGTVRVGPGRVGDADGRVVLAVLDGGPATNTLPPLDAARATYRPADTAVAPRSLGTRDPVLAQLSRSPIGPATVLVLPADALGTVELTWPDSPCRAVGSVPDSTEPVLTVPLVVSC